MKKKKVRVQNKEIRLICEMKEEGTKWSVFQIIQTSHQSNNHSHIYTQKKYVRENETDGRGASK